LSDVNWYCVLNGKQAGPFGPKTLASMIRAGQVKAQDYVCREGMQQWQPAVSVEELRTLFSVAPIPGATVPPIQYYGQQPHQVTYAGFWLRFVAVIIDRMIVEAGSCFIAVCIGSVLGARGGMRIGPSGTWSNIAVDVLFHFVRTIVGWLYYALMESGPWQATLGKKARGLMVTDLQGNRITFGRATGRHFAKIISGIILLIGYMMAGWTEKKQALHDKIAGTLVVKRQA